MPGLPRSRGGGCGAADPRFASVTLDDVESISVTIDRVEASTGEVIMAPVLVAGGEEGGDEI